MRILFFSSGLEPGCDGVGDYVRLLASACQRQGHRCVMVALHDPFVTAPVTSALADMDLLRLPADLSWAERIHLVQTLQKKFRADWISLQMVPFSFQPRGLISGLVPTLRAVCAGAALHLMFHELWVGASRLASMRHRVLGRLQASGIRRLVRQTRPRLVTTSNPVYAAMLRSLQIEAELLPLFGNIPVAALNDLWPMGNLLPELSAARMDREACWIGIFFGALHPEWLPEPLMSILARAAERARKRICFVRVGRIGSAGASVWSKMEREYENRFTFIHRGEQPVKILSALLQAADFGLATSPWQLIGKSGTAAAMLDHGLPVIVTRDDFKSTHHVLDAPSTDPLIHRCDDQLETKLVAGLPKRAPAARADKIAAALCQRLHDLQTIAP